MNILFFISNFKENFIAAEIIFRTISKISDKYFIAELSIRYSQIFEKLEKKKIESIPTSFEIKNKKLLFIQI